MATGNADLHAAAKAKKDEFYTQLSDIEMELCNYKTYFQGKTVLCNCDNPYESNFFKYFVLNFNAFKLKKLIATCYNGSAVSENNLLLDFDEEIDEPRKIAYKIEITEVKDEDRDEAIDLADVQYLLRNNKNVITELRGNGDFRSDESIEILKQSDIIVTNPPFSLFREYVAILDRYNKDFVIIGNTNTLVCKEVFRMFMHDRIRTGYTHFNTGMFFYVPDNFEKYHHIENGRKTARVSTSCWYTNLPVQKHKEELVLNKHYSPEEYPKYDNYNAIEVKTYTDIPCDYDGVMGVPITFLDKYNPKQFEIIWQASGNTRASTPKEILKLVEYVPHPEDRGGCAVLGGQRMYIRVLIRHLHPSAGAPKGEK